MVLATIFPIADIIGAIVLAASLTPLTYSAHVIPMLRPEPVDTVVDPATETTDPGDKITLPSKS